MIGWEEPNGQSAELQVGQLTIPGQEVPCLKWPVSHGP